MHLKSFVFQKGLVVISFILSFQIIQGQDLHFSQFYNSPLDVNPALTGIFNGDLRFIGKYRRQWKSVPVDYLTFNGSAEMKFYRNMEKPGFFSAGFIFEYDRAGELALSQSKFGLSSSYTWIITDRHLLTPGILMEYSQHRINFLNARTGNQWEGTRRDPLIPAEVPPNDQSSYINFSAGLNYRYQSSFRTHLDLGLGLFNLFTPQLNYTDSNNGDSQLERRLSLYAQGSFKLLSKLDILLNTHFQKQNEYDEFLVNAQAKIYLNKNQERDIALIIGAGIRAKDAIYPLIAVQYRNIYGSLSYDINTSDFDIATGNEGGPEFTFIYRFSKVPKALIKPCPIY